MAEKFEKLAIRRLKGLSVYFEDDLYTLAADVERLPVGSLWEELRKQTSEEFKALSGAAHEAAQLGC